LPLLFVLRLVGVKQRGELVTRGLFIGDDHECFERAAALAVEVNSPYCTEPLERVVVYLGRGRNSIRRGWGNQGHLSDADGHCGRGSLVVLAPGVKDVLARIRRSDRLIRNVWLSHHAGDHELDAAERGPAGQFVRGTPT